MEITVHTHYMKYNKINIDKAQLFKYALIQAKKFSIGFPLTSQLSEKHFLKLINQFIYFWLRWVFVAAHGLSLVAARGRYSSLRCVGFSLRQLLLLPSTGSRRAGFSSCGSRAQLLRGMWDLPRPGFEPVSPALAGGFLTTASPGTSGKSILET